MRTEYLEYLLEVARTKSISAAAKKLFIGQTTLSAIINSVENELNVKIFLRTHRGVGLTEHGERVIAIVEDMVAKNRQLQNLFSDTGLSAGTWPWWPIPARAARWDSTSPLA